MQAGYLRCDWFHEKQAALLGFFPRPLVDLFLTPSPTKASLSCCWKLISTGHTAPLCDHCLGRSHSFPFRGHPERLELLRTGIGSASTSLLNLCRLLAGESRSRRQVSHVPPHRRASRTIRVRYVFSLGPGTCSDHRDICAEALHPTEVWNLTTVLLVMGRALGLRQVLLAYLWASRLSLRY